ncbi:hypothetical protein BDW71DRAFT_185697 [Aspergillus fruticulosus]
MILYYQISRSGGSESIAATVGKTKDPARVIPQSEMCSGASYFSMSCQSSLPGLTFHTNTPISTRRQQWLARLRLYSVSLETASQGAS